VHGGCLPCGNAHERDGVGTKIETWPPGKGAPGACGGDWDVLPGEKEQGLCSTAAIRASLEHMVDREASSTQSSLLNAGEEVCLCLSYEKGSAEAWICRSFAPSRLCDPMCLVPSLPAWVRMLSAQCPSRPYRQ
jgi:hypothetical protein